MRSKTTVLMLLLAAGLLGCGKHQQPRHIVILPDVSGSIDRQSLEQAFKAIDELARHLQRGDRIAIIPILGDAQAEASGRIIRFEVPEERRAYDADLRDFRHKLGVALTEMQANAVAHPGSKTDILGSVELAEQEFQLVTGQPKRLLIILSDFIQEDADIDFRSDKRLAKSATAKPFARQLAKLSVADSKGFRAYLGLLTSREYRRLDKARRGAVQEFWSSYLDCLKAPSRFAVDGPGLLAEVSKESSSRP